MNRNRHNPSVSYLSSEKNSNAPNLYPNPIMGQESRSGSLEQNHKYTALSSPWQKNNISLFTIGTKNIKKRILETVKTNANSNQNEQSTSCVTTFNRYAILESTNDSMDVADTLTNQHTQKNSPPPPIFVDDVIDIQAMVKSIEKDINKEDYKLKINNDQVKILPANPDSYKKIIKLLKSLNAYFHTYQLKQERPFRVVLRNIHYSANLDELKFELLKLGHEVVNISNIRHRISKNPLSLFFVDLKQNSNNKQIYNIKQLMNSIVKIEPPLIKKEIVQCKRCQRYGHTQKYCNHNFRCVKCAGTHPTDQCTKSPETPAKCIHCQGDHPANYKGCSAYKTLYINKYPKLRAKETTNQMPNPPKFTATSISYAQAVQGNQNNLKIHRDHSQNSVSNPQNTDNFSRLEKLIEKQSEQINNLLSLLTLIMDKLICPGAK